MSDKNGPKTVVKRSSYFSAQMFGQFNVQLMA